MEITCPRCLSLHEIEPPPSARARGPRSLKFRCSHCGHTFSVDPEAPRESSTPPPLGEKPAGETILLVQVAGQIWSVPDMASLHRWILERRLDRDTLVSKHGLRWVRAGDRDDLAVFFSASDALSFQERNLRTEVPAHEDEIIVDAPEADGSDTTSVDGIGLSLGARMPVATGPGPAVGGARRGLADVMMDLDGVDDTQEQTVLTGGGLDETPIDRVPASFDRAESVAERTERMPHGNSVRSIPLPTGVSTVTPGPAPAGSAALGLPAFGNAAFGNPAFGDPAFADPAFADPAFGTPAPAVLPGPSVVPPSPLRAMTLPPSAAHASPVRPRGGAGGPSVGPAQLPSTLVPPSSAPVDPSASQSFFFEGAPPSSPQPRRDVFDDPPSSVSGTNWALWGGLAAVAAMSVLAFTLWKGQGGGPPAAADLNGTVAAAASAPPSTVGAGAAESAVEVPVATVPERVVGAGGAAVKAPEAAVPAPLVAAIAPVAPVAPVAKAAPRRDAGSAKAPSSQGAATSTTGGSPKKLVEQGWKAVEAGDYTKAHGLFERALQGGSAADALFGRGYANEKLGDGVSASNDYCRALKGAAVSIDMQREIEGGLRRLGHSCS
ncbi:MAG: hypothetical protein Q8P18_22450 [Pseudomonadota bacterium]|nr:hypothetical protein [Pseudomonadota bacterium]